MLRPLNAFEKANTEFLESLPLRYGYLQPTATGLRHKILDARREYRAFLQKDIHDYENQPHSRITNGRKLPASFISRDDVVDLPEASLYRANTRGDRRIWFPDIPQYVSPGETLLTLWLNEQFWLLNASRMVFSESHVLSAVVRMHGHMPQQDDGFLGRPEGFWDNAETDSVALSKVREEQADLRRHLLQGKAVAHCSICAAELPARLLIAGHIKPRSRCNEAERRDYMSAAMLICSLGCDVLFEWGYIVVDGSGMVRPARIPETVAVSAAVGAVCGNTCLAFSEDTSQNFAAHASLVAEA